MAQALEQQSKVRGLEAIFPRPEVTDRQAYAPGIKISPELDLVPEPSPRPMAPGQDQEAGQSSEPGRQRDGDRRDLAPNGRAEEAPA